MSYKIFKYNIRLILVPLVSKFLFSLGYDWRFLGKKFGREVIISQLQFLNKKFHINLPKNNPPLSIYILTITCGNTYNLCLEILLAFGLKFRGHKVKFVLDDLQLPITTDTKADNEDNWESIVYRGFSFGKRMISKAGFEIVYVSNLINNNEISNNHKEFSEIVEASLLKHYKVGVLDEDSAEVRQRRKLFEKAVKLSSHLGDKIIDLKPDRIIMSTGIYSTWGPPRIVLNNAKIPVLTYSKTKKKDTEKFNWKYASDWWDVSNEWKKIKEIPLTIDENKKLDDYLDSRITHEKDVLKYNFGLYEDHKETFRRLNLSQDKPVYSLYTNVLWDAASAQREIAFSNPVDWVYRTINWFIKNQEYQLIVKIHPAEVVIGTNQPFYNLINEKYDELPNNIRIIRPEEKINSWSIVNISSLGLVHTSTVGLELPLKGIPCIVASKTHFRGKGFTIDIENEVDYFDLLKNFDKKNYDIDKMITYARRYSYLLFERYQIPFPFFYEPFWTDVRALNIERYDDLFINKHFNFIIDCIENKKEFVLPAELI